jgi:glycosyltransferase involved in cell wall biosynthesis
MKIAVWHNLPSGGGKRALYYHVRGLVERGHSVESWCLDTADRAYLPLTEFAPEHVVRSESAQRSRNWFIKRFAPSFQAAIERMRAFDQACKRCADEMEAGGFDLLFANSTIQFAVPYITRHVRLPRVLYLQEPNRYLYEASPILPWVAGASDNLEQAARLQPRALLAHYVNLQNLRLHAKQEWLSVRACDQILVNSYFSRESIRRAYGVDARVCYLGIDTTIFRNLGLRREHFIVGLGSFNPIKGIDLAVKAVALLPEPRPPLVWIANSGSETYQREMSELARSSGVQLRIQRAISDTELVATLNKAALLLCTSRLEPFGLAPLEANACGLPVVGIAEGGLRETIHNGVNGFLVEPEAEDIARAAKELLRNPERAKQMGENGVFHVQQNWQVESSVNRLEQILLQVARKHQPGGEQ